MKYKIMFRLSEKTFVHYTIKDEHLDRVHVFGEDRKLLYDARADDEKCVINMQENSDEMFQKIRGVRKDAEKLDADLSEWPQYAVLDEGAALELKLNHFNEILLEQVD